jgi:hypothetical protein
LEPMNPAPPVTRIFTFLVFLTLLGTESPMIPADQFGHVVTPSPACPARKPLSCRGGMW